MLHSVRPGDFLMLIPANENYETGFYPIVDTSGPNEFYSTVTFETGNGDMIASKTIDGYKVQGINIPHSVEFVLNLPGINPMNVKTGQRVIMRGPGLELLGIETAEERGVIAFVSDNKSAINVAIGPHRDIDGPEVTLKWGLSSMGRSDWIVSAQRGDGVVKRSLRLIEE